jgi:putative tryptophan/tyrosine transport system substrate-binding protein
VKRREFIALLGSAASLVASPRIGRAQQQKMPVVGWLRSASNADAVSLVAGFRQGLKESDFIDGSNVSIEFRSAEGNGERLAALTQELIHQPVTILVGNTEAALVAKAASTTVPIVFVTGFDPVKDGLVPSLNRPGGNVTGVTFIGGSLGGKRFELLRQVAPKGAAIGLLVNPNSFDNEADRKEVQAAAASSGQPLVVVEVKNASDIDAAFATLVQRCVGAVMTGAGAFFFSNRKQIVALATRYRLPSSFDVRVGVEAGGLMSYGPSIAGAYHEAGIYVARILKGERPADLPVVQSTKFEFVINLKTAEALGITMPPNLLALADDVIE